MTDMLPGLAADPDEVMYAAVREHAPRRVFCLFSGGHDSTVLAHRMRRHYHELAFIDTGTALPGVKEFINDFAFAMAKPLRVLEAGDAFRTLVLGDDAWWMNFGVDYLAWREQNPDAPMSTFNGLLRKAYGRAQGDGLGQPPHGFPGPAGHNVAYTRLKERQVEQLVRDAKAEFAPGDRFARIGLLTGTRRSESARRARTQKAACRRVKAQIWINPLLDWTNDQMRTYRADHALPESDVAALLHRSGECNCGSFAAPGERGDLEALYPEWVASFLEPLEAEAERRQILGCRWGERPHEAPAPTGPLCSDCQLRLAA